MALPKSNAANRWSSLIWVCTVCPDVSVRKLRIITVVYRLIEILQYHNHVLVVNRFDRNIMLFSQNEPPHDKTKKMTCAPSKDSDQPVQWPVWSESSLSAWRMLGSLATHCWSESSLGMQSFCWFCREAAQILKSSSSAKYCLFSKDRHLLNNNHVPPPCFL